MRQQNQDLRRYQKQKAIERDVALLRKAIRGAPVGDPSDEEMREVYRVAKKGRAKVNART